MYTDIYIFIFILGILLFNWPLISIFKNSTIIYIFIAWFLFIFIIFISSYYTKDIENKEGREN